MASSATPSSSTMFNASRFTLTKTFCGSSLTEAKNLALAMWRIRKLKINCEATSTNTVVATPETVKRVVDIVANQLATSADSINPHSKFQDLGADSLDQVEIVMALEEEFNISVSENGAESISTVQDAADLIQRAVSDES